MAITPIYFHHETSDGTTHEPVRVFVADKIAAERSAHMQGWEWRDSPQIHTLMGYYAVKRVTGGDFPDYKEWMTSLVDYEMTNTLNDKDDAEDPTQAV